MEALPSISTRSGLTLWTLLGFNPLPLLKRGVLWCHQGAIKVPSRCPGGLQCQVVVGYHVVSGISPKCVINLLALKSLTINWFIVFSDMMQQLAWQLPLPRNICIQH